jgi:hypothetical protein
VGLERGPLSLVRINEELHERKVAAPVKKTEINDRGRPAALTTRYPSIRKSWHYIPPTIGGRSVGIVRLRTKGHEVCFIYIVTRSGVPEWTLLRNQQRPFCGSVSPQ